MAKIEGEIQLPERGLQRRAVTFCSWHPVVAMVWRPHQRRGLVCGMQPHMPSGAGEKLL